MGVAAKIGAVVSISKSGIIILFDSLPASSVTIIWTPVYFPCDKVENVIVLLPITAEELGSGGVGRAGVPTAGVYTLTVPGLVELNLNLGVVTLEGVDII